MFCVLSITLSHTSAIIWFTAAISDLKVGGAFLRRYGSFGITVLRILVPFLSSSLNMGVNSGMSFINDSIFKSEDSGAATGSSGTAGAVGPTEDTGTAGATGATGACLDTAAGL